MAVWAILPKTIGRKEPLHLLVDSTGLKIYGTGEWLDQKRGLRSPRRWRKLHLGVDAGTHAIVAVELTPDNVGDVSELSGLLDQIEADVAPLTADGRMMERRFTMLWPTAILTPRSLFHRAPRQFPTR